MFQQDCFRRRAFLHLAQSTAQSTSALCSGPRLLSPVPPATSTEKQRLLQLPEPQSAVKDKRHKRRPSTTAEISKSVMEQASFTATREQHHPSDGKQTSSFTIRTHHERYYRHGTSAYTNIEVAFLTVNTYHG